MEYSNLTLTTGCSGVECKTQPPLWLSHRHSCCPFLYPCQSKVRRKCLCSRFSKANTDFLLSYTHLLVKVKNPIPQTRQPTRRPTRRPIVGRQTRWPTCWQTHRWDRILNFYPFVQEPCGQVSLWYEPKMILIFIFTG